MSSDSLKTVLITGGAKRLGRALVEHFHQAGWRVLFTAQWSFEEGMQLAEALGENVHCVRAQASSQSNASVIQQWAAKHTDRIDLLVCSASTFKRMSLEETRPSDFVDMLESNLMGPYFLIQQCLPMLVAAGGSVVNIADAQALGAVPNFSAYAAAKAGLISITKSLALELAPTVRVNVVLPGTLDWPADDKIYAPEEMASIEAQVPLQRKGTWADVVGAVDYLAGAKFVTGFCLAIDGGRSART
jgi:pteridine reductase